MTGPAVLLVEDDRELAGMLERLLRSEGYEVSHAPDGHTALHLGLTQSFDALVVDRGLPAIEGLDLLVRLRGRGVTTPALILSSRATVGDRIAGLDAGAEDYLTKPFDVDELRARVRVQLRDSSYGRVETISNGGLTLDLWRLQADSGHGRVPLTRLEFLLLRTLMEHPGHSVPKDQLLSSVWGYDFDPGSNVVDVCVRRLRSKLGFELIKTVRGEGYQLASG
jgi:DNA-binding response OmpR family regulator